MNHYQLIVIGAGPGGYQAALEAAHKGMSVAIVEAQQLGGTCLNRGCIPTKTIMHTTELYQELSHAEQLGLELSDLHCNMSKIQARKETVLEQLRGGIATLLKQAKITVYNGTGTITAPHRVQVSGTEPVELEADYILIATGSVPVVPPIPGIDLPNVLTSDGLLSKEEVYPRLTIIGGGVIGMEFASIYGALGCQVTVIEAMDRILANMDKEIGQNLKMILKKRNVDIHAGARVDQIAQDADGSLICHYTEKDKACTVAADGILVSVGRKPCTAGLFGPGLEIATERGRILVNSHYQTNYDHIYAIGDVIGGIQLAHVATAEGYNAVSHMLGEAPSVSMTAVPSCVYTSPEISSVGISSEEAKQLGLEVITNKYIMSANGKTVLSLQERGFIKVIADAQTRKILGAQMMCARATDLINEFASAIVNGLTLDQMASVIRPHPTFSEAITEVVRV